MCDQWDDSVDKGDCHQAGYHEFNIRTEKVEKENGFLADPYVNICNTNH